MSSPITKLATTDQQQRTSPALPENNTPQPTPIINATATPPTLRTARSGAHSLDAGNRKAIVIATDSKDDLTTAQLTEIDETIKELQQKIKKCETALKALTSTHSEFKKIQQEIQQFKQKILALEEKKIQLLGVSVVKPTQPNDQRIQRAQILLGALYGRIEQKKIALSSMGQTAAQENETRLFYRSSKEEFVIASIRGYLTDPTWNVETMTLLLRHLDQNNDLRLDEVAVKTLLKELDLFSEIKNEIIAAAKSGNQAQVIHLLRQLPPENLDLLKSLIQHLHVIFNTPTSFKNASVTLIPPILNKNDDIDFIQNTQRIGPTILCSEVLASDDEEPTARAIHPTPLSASSISQTSTMDGMDYLFSDSRETIEKHYSTMINTLQTSLAGKDKAAMQQELSQLKTVQITFLKTQHTAGISKTEGEEIATLEFQLKALESKPGNHDAEIKKLEQEVQARRIKFMATEEGKRQAQIKKLESQLDFVSRTETAIQKLTQEKAAKLRILSADSSTTVSKQTADELAAFFDSQ